AARAVSARIELEIVERQRLRAGCGHAATDDRTEPREQLFERKRLDEIVVGARIEASDAVAEAVTGGEHEDWHPIPFGAKTPAHRKPVKFGHRDIEHNGVGRT